MGTVDRQRIDRELAPLLSAEETIRHSGLAATKPPRWVFVVMLPVTLVALVGAVLAAQGAIDVGLIQPGPMMPLVGVPIGGAIFLVPFLLLMQKTVRRYGVGLTERRLLVVDLDGKAGPAVGAYAQPDPLRFARAKGAMPSLLVKHDGGASTLSFGLGVSDNRKHGAAIVDAVVASTPMAASVDSVIAPSSDLWSSAIAAAERGQREEAIQDFGRAIASNPNYYISDVKPESARAAACWKEAVDRYVRASALTPKAEGSAAQCHKCGKSIGVDWHYDFESVVMAMTVAAQCPKCGAFTCRDDLKYGPDGNYPPCSQCHVPVESLSAGPAASSMVDDAKARRRYRGALQPPSALGRAVEVG